MIRSVQAMLLCALAVVLAPAAALACAVCTGGGEESKTAFILTTIGMSVAPLAMLGALGWWIWRRVRAVESERQTTASPERPAHLPG